MNKLRLDPRYTELEEFLIKLFAEIEKENDLFLLQLICLLFTRLVEETLNNIDLEPYEYLVMLKHITKQINCNIDTDT